MKIVRFKTVGGKSLVMISLLLMAPMHIYSSDTFTIQEKTRVHQQTVQLTGVVLEYPRFPFSWCKYYGKCHKWYDYRH